MTTLGLTRQDTSQWTLDYPPLFAWFEYSLSQVAQFFDPDMLIGMAHGPSSDCPWVIICQSEAMYDTRRPWLSGPGLAIQLNAPLSPPPAVSNLEYASLATVAFQRCSVMVTDLLLYYAALQYGPITPIVLSTTLRGAHEYFTVTVAFRTSGSGASVAQCRRPAFRRFAKLLPAGGTPRRDAYVYVTLVVCSAGLFIVDHIHFQYNGMLLGILLLSMARIIEVRL
jgi:alpha-1,3-glucosyltransferase